MKKELIEEYGKYKVYEVDGKEVRNSSKSNEEFTDWAVHGKGISQLETVPKNELWIDKNLNEEDKDIAIDSGLYYLELESKNKNLSNEKLYDKVVKLSKRNREHFGKEHPIGKEYKVKREDKIKVSGPIKLPSKNNAWIVNGTSIRNKIKNDFVLGGNSEVYKWIPDNEIWIEQDVDSSERIYILIHELVEWYQMKSLGTSYDKAHHKANLIEYKWRHNKNIPKISDLTVKWIHKQLGE